MSKSANPYSAPDAESAPSSNQFGGLLWRSVLTIVGSMILIGIIGGLLGMLLGIVAPEYYRTVFSNAAQGPAFSPVQLGLGLGATQGAGVGLVVGCVSVIAVSIFRKRLIRQADAQRRSD